MYALKFQYNDSDGGYTLKRELKLMKKLHENETEGSKFLIKPAEELE